MNWDEHFIYDPSIPEGLRWNRFAANRRIKPNDPAGKFAHKSTTLTEGISELTLLTGLMQIIE